MYINNIVYIKRQYSFLEIIKKKKLNLKLYITVNIINNMVITRALMLLTKKNYNKSNYIIIQIYKIC